MAENCRLKVYLDYEEMFRCPICSQPMQVNHRSLVCPQNHTFDISKHGHVNMLSGIYKSKYDKNMYLSRRLINKMGFFNPLMEKIGLLITQGIESQVRQIKILDAGCGEGYHLTEIKERVSPNSSKKILGAGLDISKEAIIMAGKKHRNEIWCVADINKIPFQSNQFDFILNILSPSNYAEFKRILKKKGQIIKVVPNSNYLQELREVFYKKTEQASYSNAKTIELFERNLKVLDIKQIRYRVAVDRGYLENLSIMTPLSWGRSKRKMEKLLESNINTVTADFSILIGKR